MKSNKIIFIAILTILTGNLFASHSEALIKLDKQWDLTDGTGAEFISKDIIVIGTDGVGGFKEMTTIPADAPAPTDK